MKKILVYLVLIAGFVFLIVSADIFRRQLINEKFCSSYEKGIYRGDLEEKLLSGNNLPEGSVPLYNMGNVSYKEGNYPMAAAYYEEALEADPPEGKECPVRINLALALIHMIDFEDLDTARKVDAAIEQLLAARDVLTEEGCANPKDDGGHSPEAEQLKKEIDEMLEKLRENRPEDEEDEKEEEQDSQEEQGEEESKPNQSRKPSQREKRLKERLEEQKNEAMKEREKEQRRAGQNAEEEEGSGGEGEEDGGSSYGGKNW